MKDIEMENAYKFSTIHIKASRDIKVGFESGWISRGMNDIKKLDAYEKGFKDGSHSKSIIIIEELLTKIHSIKQEYLQGNDVYEYLNDLDILLSKEAIKLGLVGKMSKSEDEDDA